MFLCLHMLPLSGQDLIFTVLCCMQPQQVPTTCGLPELQSFKSLEQLYKRFAYGKPSLDQKSFLELEEESEKAEEKGTGKKGAWRAGASRDRW